MNLSKYLHPTTIRWANLMLLRTGETASESDLMLVDRTVRELANSALGGGGSGGVNGTAAGANLRPLGQSIFAGRKLVAWYPMLGPSIEAARVPVINTTDPRDPLNTSPIGNELLVERYTPTDAWRKNRWFRADLGVRSDPIGGPNNDNNLFYRTGLTVTKISAANTLMGLTPGCMSFGFSLNSATAFGSSILGFNDSGTFWAHIDTAGQLRAGINSTNGAWDVSVAGATITPAAYVVSRRAANYARALKDGVQIHERTTTDTLLTAQTWEIPILCRGDANGAAVGNRYTGYVSDVWFGLQLTADEEMTLGDIFARHRSRRLNS